MSLPTYTQDDKRAAELAHVSSFALLLCAAGWQVVPFLMMHPTDDSARLGSGYHLGHHRLKFCATTTRPDIK